VTRLLGIDLGERRIGLALAETDGQARPLQTIRRGRRPSADIAALARVIADQAIDELVVGLPLEASGVEGRQSGLTRDWAEAVVPALGRPVSYRDERLTSHLAEQRLGPMPRGRSGGPPTAHQRDAYRARVDREAAAIILQDELDARTAAATDAANGAAARDRTRVVDRSTTTTASTGSDA
jgi:putative holliday junction resolvase